jgi:hypothetical protein
VAIKTELTELKGSIANTSAERTQHLGRIQLLEHELQQARMESQSLKPIDQQLLNVINLPQATIQILETDGSYQDVPKYGSYDGVAVVFEKIVHNSLDRLPRIVQLYQQIGTIALVQHFLGIAKYQGVKYALMEDLRGYESVGAATATGNKLALGRAEKIRFMYELAATVSSLHEARILVKTMSDETVYLRKHQKNRVRPLISNLSHARAVSQQI